VPDVPVEAFEALMRYAYSDGSISLDGMSTGQLFDLHGAGFAMILPLEIRN
jgi:hypothetical protein